MEYFKKSLCCVYKVVMEVQDEDKIISLNISRIGSRLEDFERNLHTQEREIGYIS